MNGLRRIEWWAILLVSLLVFLFANGPMWQRPFDIDGHIVWSYLIIPVLVAVVLLRGGRFRSGPFALATLELILIKFMITLSFFAVPAWIAAGDPERRPRPSYAAPAVAPPPARPAPTRIPDDITGVIRGVVVGAEGPVEGVLVYVESGLEDFVFAPPKAPVRLTNQGNGPAPSLAVLHPFQDLTLSSEDNQLHVLAASDEGGHPAFTLPMLSGGRERTLHLPTRHGLFSLRCRVHEGGRESQAHLLVLSHPHYSRSDAEGRFELRGVPSSQVVLRAWTAEGDTHEALLIEPGKQHTVTLDLTNAKG